MKNSPPRLEAPSSAIEMSAARTGIFRKWLGRIISWIGLGLLLALAFGLRSWNSPQVFHDDGVFFVDADCYSRMTRVLRVLEAPLTSIRFHDFENAPDGTFPHTTAPMDLAIAALAGVFDGQFSLLDSNRAVDLAGAFISPLLGVLLVAFLWGWGRASALPYRNALLLLVCVSPILVHGFLLGRPDHQSLILLLFGVALAAEIMIWQRRNAAWGVVSAVAWGLALWTSLFEPLILLVAILACRGLVLGREAWRLRNRTAAVVFLGVLAVALIFDGWRFQPSGTSGEVFSRWALTIGELNHLTFKQLLPWTGWLLPVVPVLLILRFAKERCRLCLALALLVLLTAGLSLWYARWGYFLALTFAFSLPWAFAAIPWKPAVWALFLLSLWPLADEWDRQFFPDKKTQEARAEAREDARLLRETALFLRSAGSGNFLAPWWLSPPLAYWSGLPGVAGSSHQSLPGIVDSAKFYLSPTDPAAREILQRRQVRWVVAYEPSRVIANSTQILGQPPPGIPLVQKLYGHQSLFPPPFLRRAYQNPYFKVFETTDAPAAGQ